MSAWRLPNKGHTLNAWQLHLDVCWMRLQAPFFLLVPCLCFLDVLSQSCITFVIRKTITTFKVAATLIWHSSPGKGGSMFKHPYLCLLETMIFPGPTFSLWDPQLWEHLA